MDQDFETEVLSHVLNHTNDTELRILANQCYREAVSGFPLEDVITQVQCQLGLSYSDAKRVEGMVREAVAPPGREKQVKELKKHKDIDNPFAVAWHSYDQSKGKEPKKKAGDSSLTSMLDPEDPIDMAIMDLLNGARDAGVIGGEPGDMHRVLEMLADRVDVLLSEGESGEAPNLPADVHASLKATAGLKSTLRKLRQQLNKHDHEDLDGMSKLLSCIEGIERQLEHKSKAKEERSKKRQEKEAEAAGPVPSGTPGDLPADNGQPEDLPRPAPEVMKAPEELAADAIDFGMLKSKVAALKADIDKLYQVKEKSTEFESKTKPMLLSYLDTLEDHRMLIEYAEKKWSVLRVQEATPEPTLDKSKLLEGIKKRIAEAVAKGVKYAEELDRSIKAMERHPSYQTEPKEKEPYLKIGPSPKDMQNVPYNKVPPRSASLRATADMLSSLFAGLDEALQELADLVDVAESKLQPAF